MLINSKWLLLSNRNNWVSFVAHLRWTFIGQPALLQASETTEWTNNKSLMWNNLDTSSFSRKLCLHFRSHHSDEEADSVMNL